MLALNLLSEDMVVSLACGVNGRQAFQYPVARWAPVEFWSVILGRLVDFVGRIAVARGAGRRRGCSSHKHENTSSEPETPPRG